MEKSGSSSLRVADNSDRGTSCAKSVKLTLVRIRVGHWEGKTFVVDSNNFNDATWLDQYGFPHSDRMIVEERYHRLDHDHPEMILNISAPRTCVGSWRGDKKIFQLVEKPARSEFDDLPRNICAF